MLQHVHEVVVDSGILVGAERWIFAFLDLLRGAIVRVVLQNVLDAI